MTNPSVNPSNTGSLQGTMAHVLEKFLQGVDDMLPAKVISFDRDTNRATVQPLVMVLKTDGETQIRAEIASVPVFQYSGGGFVINFPLEAGDIGWLKANDRDISLFKQSYAESAPNTYRKHNFSDSMFFPDVMRGWVIEEAGLVIQSMDGSQCISIQDDKIKIKGTDIQVEATADVIMNAETVTITASSRIDITAPQIELTGALTGAGNAIFQGSITAEDEITTELNGGINLSDHIHSGVTSGGANTGEPV